ncbi:regulator of Vps4 activity in the MVB pathway-domain-containing protein [Scheffersomyces xylosifermentans]|uniref:regulator of Vps4 activity in the MVB pathway-domain-containing protein n=1 Tax=Scheffersomyces xylosifermentans TaxID=1304137 RepID=UPI00315DDD9F
MSHNSKPPPPHLNPARLKTALKMAISKSKFIQEKKSALTKQQRRQLADLLTQGKESSATIRVENIIRDDIYIELLEFIELYCELLLARISIILDPARTTCDASLIEAVQSVIYATPHTELKELNQIRDILIYKYGVDFGKAAKDNIDNFVPAKIVSRCQVDPPPQKLVEMYLCEIAKAYEAPYSKLRELELEQNLEDEKKAAEKKDDDENGDDDDEDGGSGGIKVPNPPIAETTDEPGTSKPAVVAPPVVPPVDKPVSAAKKQQNEFDELKARFAALKGL